MGEISQRADRFIRQVFQKKGTDTVSSPAAESKAKKLDKAMEARRKAINRRKGY